MYIFRHAEKAGASSLDEGTVEGRHGELGVYSFQGAVYASDVHCWRRLDAALSGAYTYSAYSAYC